MSAYIDGLTRFGFAIEHIFANSSLTLGAAEFLLLEVVRDGLVLANGCFQVSS